MTYLDEMFGMTAAPEEIAALKATDDARDAEKLAAMGLTRGQVVIFSGDECTVVCSQGAGAVMLHCAVPERMGFVCDGAAIPVSSLTRREG